MKLQFITISLLIVFFIPSFHTSRGVSLFKTSTVPKCTQNKVVLPKNTPENVQHAIQRILLSQATTHFHTVWTRPGYLCSNITQDLMGYRHEKQTLPEPTNNPCELEPGEVYNWVITDDLQITFGRIENILEWGVQHPNLASGRYAVAGGVLTIDSNKGVLYNLKSGSFVWKVGLARPSGPVLFSETLVLLIERVFEEFECRTQFYRTVDDLPYLKNHLPISLSYLGEKCMSDCWFQHGALNWRSSSFGASPNVCAYFLSSHHHQDLASLDDFCQYHRNLTVSRVKQTPHHHRRHFSTFQSIQSKLKEKKSGN